MNREYQNYYGDLSSLNCQEIYEKSHQLFGRVYEIISNQKRKELSKLVDELGGLQLSISVEMGELEGRQGENINVIFEMGKIFALLELCESLDKQARIEQKSTKPKTVYRDFILECLYEQGMLLHKDLALKLGVSPSNLTNIMQRMQNEEIQLIKVNELGKYKYYMLTSYGQSYVKRHLRPKDERLSKRRKKDKCSFVYFYGEIKNGQTITTSDVNSLQKTSIFNAEIYNRLYMEKLKMKDKEPLWEKYERAPENRQIISNRVLEEIR